MNFSEHINLFSLKKVLVEDFDEKKSERDDKIQTPKKKKTRNKKFR